MMNLFDGLYPYEAVLMVLGVVLFVVLVIAFIVLIVKGRPFGTLLSFFAVPVVMIGFPSIKSIQFHDGVVTVDKLTHDLQQDPTNAALRTSLDKQVAEVTSRPTTNPASVAAIGSAQFALGDHIAAAINLRKALEAAPQLTQALELKKRIDLDNTLTKVITQVQQHPDDAAAKESLRKAVAEAGQLQIASPQLLTNIARAHAAIGNRTEALNLADKALAINPSLNLAKQVKSQMTR